MSTHLPIRRLFATALLATAVAATATACSDGASGTAQTSESAPVAELSASFSPAEKLEAAVTRTLFSGPIRVSAEAQGIATEDQLDYSRQITYTEMNDASLPVQAALTKGDVMYVKPGPGAGEAQAGTWYRVAGDGEMTQMMQMLQQSLDPAYVKKVILSSKEVVERGREDVNGVSATHFVVTPDLDVLIDMTLEMLPAEMKSTGAEYRELVKSQLPSTLHYWVDDNGNLVKDDDGSQVRLYHSFGEPLDLPEFDESAVEDLPLG